MEGTMKSLVVKLHSEDIELLGGIAKADNRSRNNLLIHWVTACLAFSKEHGDPVQVMMDYKNGWHFEDDQMDDEA